MGALLRRNKQRIVSKQLVIAGGGLAGICAAVAAARQGVTVALVQERPVLGGNSSSEVRVWACGATAMGHNHYADETGIINELILENLSRNKEGNPYLWDLLLLEFVQREAKLELYLNTCIDKVIGKGRLIKEISGIQLGSETRLRFQAPLFIDCTGDGTVGFLAGAAYMQGREARGDFGESLAPPRADQRTLGSSIFFTVKDLGREVVFEPPDWAYSSERIKRILAGGDRQLRPDRDGCNLWWVEYGGMLDTVGSNELIKAELHKIVYGVWNYLKNSGEFAAQNLTLEWVGSIPGKRESRRLQGSYILTQNDLLNQTQFDDTIGYGGWPIDLHPEEGIYSENPACHQVPVGLYAIPLRCLYSTDIDNLLFAGRNISVSHVALASTRVMKTCAVLGQAAGTAAALATARGKVPKNFSGQDIKALQQTLLKNDCWIPGLKNTDPFDRARMATVKASGTKKFEALISCGTCQLDADFFLLFPQLATFEKLGLLVDCLVDTYLEIEVFESKRYDVYAPFRKLTDQRQPVAAGREVWAGIALGLHSIKNNVIVKINRHPEVGLHLAADGCYGMLALKGNYWGLNPLHPCFQITPAVNFYAPDNVVSGSNRTFGKPDLWVSNSIQEAPLWLELDLGQTVSVTEVILYLNHDLNRDYNNLQPDFYGNNWDRIYEGLLKDFRVLLLDSAGAPQAELPVRGNRSRRVVLRFDQVAARRLRLEIEATYGGNYAEVYEIRVY